MSHHSQRLPQNNAHASWAQHGFFLRNHADWAHGQTVEQSQVQRRSRKWPANWIAIYRNALERWAFYALVALMVIPLWAFHYFPSQDGPMHLYNALVLRDYNAPANTALREFFRPNPSFVPNWLGPHLLPVLMNWLSPMAAEKTLLTGYLILLPLAIRYALIGIRPQAKVLSIAALPLVPNNFYHMGFEDFCLSLVGFFVAIGFFARRRDRFGWTHSAVLAIILLATYLTHLVSVVMVLPLLTLCGICQYWSRQQPLLVKVKQSLPLAVAMAPVSGVTLFFIMQRHTTAMLHPWPQGWVHRFYFLIGWMKAYQFRDLLPATALFVTFALLTLWLFKRAFQKNADNPRVLLNGMAGGLLLSGLLYTTIFLIAPDAAAGGQLLCIRLAAYPMFAALLWMAALPLGPTTFRWISRVLVTVSVPSFLFLLVSTSVAYSELNHYLDEFATVTPHVASNSLLLPMHYEDFRDFAPNSAHRLSVGIDPFRHASAAGLAEKGVVDLADYWATTDHQSLRWQPGLDPMSVGMDRCDYFLAWSRKTGRPIDYILLFSGGLRHDELQGRMIASELSHSNYRLIFTSPTTGYLKLYQLAEPASPAASTGIMLASKQNIW